MAVAPGKKAVPMTPTPKAQQTQTQTPAPPAPTHTIEEPLLTAAKTTGPAEIGPLTRPPVPQGEGRRLIQSSLRT